MGKILLEEIEFYAYHGVYSEEQKIGGKYLIDIELEVNLDAPSKTDDLEDTIDYSLVYHVLKEEMDVPSRLIEHVAGRILEALFQKFEGLDHVKIKLTKVKPPIEAQVKSVSVVLEERRKP
jgi:dihydroneopterin aldolase